MASEYIVERPARNSEAIIDEGVAERAALSSFLRNNPGQVFPGKILARECGLSSAGGCASVRAAVRVLRFRGEPIISTSKGYMYVDDPFQREACARRLERRAGEILLAAKKLRGEN